MLYSCSSLSRYVSHDHSSKIFSSSSSSRLVWYRVHSLVKIDCTRRPSIDFPTCASDNYRPLSPLRNASGAKLYEVISEF